MTFQKRKNKQVRGRKSAPKKRGGPKRRSTKRGKSSPKNGRVASIQRLVIDPCRAAIVPGIYGSCEGLTARVKNSHSENGSIADTCGAIFWVPAYNNAGGTHWNMIRFSGTSPTSMFLNNNADPMGAGSISSRNGLALQDPGSPFVSTGLVRDVRTLAACLQLTYTGKMTDSAGQIAWIQNYSLADLLKNGVHNVNDLFNRATKTQRLGLDTYEVVFRPDVDSGTARFRAGGGEDNCVTMGVPGTSSSTLGTDPSLLSPKVIGFAWRGCEDGILNKLAIATTKVVEWRPDIDSGLTGTAQTDLDLPSTSNIVAGLDSMMPGWSARVATEASSLASHVAESAWQGVQTQTGKAFAGIGSAGALYLKAKQNH